MANTVYIRIISIFPRLVNSTCAADESRSRHTAKQLAQKPAAALVSVSAAAEPNYEAIDMFFCNSNDDVVICECDLERLVSSTSVAV